jgi:hypothetical protein
MARASSRGVQRRTEEKGDLLSAQEVPPWHGEAVHAWPRRHQARGRGRRYVGKPPHPPAPDLAEGKAKQLEMKLEVAMAEIQGAGGDRAEGIDGGNRPDLTDRQERRREIYRFLPISVANFGGGRRNRARRRRDDTVARAWARGTREVSEASNRSV